MGEHTISRIVVDGILFVGVLFAPWWVVACGVVVSAFFFDLFAESIIIGTLYDIFYGGMVAGAGGYEGFRAGLIVFLVAYFARSTIALVRRI